MDTINIRFASLKDLENVLAFIKNYWDDESIFLECPEIFEYEYVNSGKLNFVIAETGENSEIYGVLGYMKYNEEEHSNITPCIWTSRPYTGRMIGIEMMQFLKQQLNPSLYFSCGVRRKTVPIYKYLKWKTGKLNHYYRLGDHEVYKIACIQNKIILQVSPEGYQLQPIKNFDELNSKFENNDVSKMPYKSNIYLKKRYFEHPVYEYGVWGIDSGKNQYTSLIITREITMEQAKMLRIVDFIGEEEELALCGQAFQKLIVENGYEYIEFYNHGIDEGCFKKAGFILWTQEDMNILPSHFEPFVRENIEHYYFIADDKKMKIFKGDSNQDSPRRLSKK